MPPNSGVCCWRPPVAVPVAIPVPASPANPKGVGMGAQPIRPPVFEHEGCGQWAKNQATQPN